jgi:hypothetical protein
MRFVKTILKIRQSIRLTQLMLKKLQIQFLLLPAMFVKLCVTLGTNSFQRVCDLSYYYKTRIIFETFKSSNKSLYFFQMILSD